VEVLQFENGREAMRLRIAISLVAAMVLCGAAASVYAQGTVPANTEVIVSLDQAVSSKDAKVGQKIPGSVAQAVVVDGKTVIPKGAKCTLSVADAQPSGHLKGQAKLWLKINSVVVNGKTTALNTSSSGQTGPAHNKRNVIAIGGGTAAGALIGGLAGGGKGAAIGAGVGAAAGTAGAAATGKKDVNFPAETKLRFTTKTAVTIPK
jgi:hypothetical protein